MCNLEEKQRILQKHFEVLNKFEKERIFGITINEETEEFVIRECCDEWFCEGLTKDDCEKLSEMFNDMSQLI